KTIRILELAKIQGGAIGVPPRRPGLTRFTAPGESAAEVRRWRAFAGQAQKQLLRLPGLIHGRIGSQIDKDRDRLPDLQGSQRQGHAQADTCVRILQELANGRLVAADRLADRLRSE